MQHCQSGKTEEVTARSGTSSGRLVHPRQGTTAVVLLDEITNGHGEIRWRRVRKIPEAGLDHLVIAVVDEDVVESYDVLDDLVTIWAGIVGELLSGREVHELCRRGSPRRQAEIKSQVESADEI